MKIKDTKLSSVLYTETMQSNNIRWRILTPIGEELVTQTAWFKCRDYFNDVVASYNDIGKWCVYGFDTTKMQLPENGQPLYIQLKNLHPKFKDNLANVNVWLLDNQWPMLEFSEDVLILDAFYLKNTYNISLITMIVRMINDEVDFSTKHGFSNDLYDNNRWVKVCTRGKFFNYTDDKPYVWYCNKYYNDCFKNDNYITMLVHNNGVDSWIVADGLI